MKKLGIGLLLAIFLVAVGWSASAEAACDKATFKCYDKRSNLLGEISVTCSEKVPLGGLVPRCLPDFPLVPFASIDACKSTYPASFRACPNQPWPSGYEYSTCISYPTL